MKDIKTYRQLDLVLNINHNYDPLKLDLTKWELFLDLLCGNREYQKEAIKNSVVFLASGNYNSTRDLALENYNKNSVLQAKYSSFLDMENHLQIPNKLHANIDLATGTGKSYVMYGIAQILLSIGIVKRVLVLAPSVTIEKELTKKFLDLSGDDNLRKSIPENSKYILPRIIDGNSTILEGDICIENIHAVYENTGSSIDDSFKNGGEDTLILNDESHHIYNEPQSVSRNSSYGRNIKKWKEFLISPQSNFKYVLGFTGTAYLDDDYFTDVIYRYSLREAIENRVVKSINYVQEDDSGRNKYHKFQKIHKNHQDNINVNRSSGIRPITILITKDIRHAEMLYEDLVNFLIDWEGLSREHVNDKVLIVTSSNKHAENLLKLEYVDETDSKVEWIISVSMLTEGWDVKNVFQIVPWEDRAFNSKLLIAQVLGRGLRIPENYKSGHPSVVVFNHDSWSKNIKNLVDEVLEIETRIISSVKYEGERNKYNFSVYNLDYEKEDKIIDHEKTKSYDYSRTWDQGIKLVSQSESDLKETKYEELYSGQLFKTEYDIKYKVHHVNKIVNKIMFKFKTLDWESEILGIDETEVYSKDHLPPKGKIIKIIKKSMKKVGITGDYLIEDNVHRINRAFDTLFRSSSKTVIPINKYKEPYLIHSKNMNNESLGISNFRRDSTVFYANDIEEVAVSEEQNTVFKEFLNDGTLPRKSASAQNKHLFKTPQNLVFATRDPEIKFVQHLCKKENAASIDAWFKSRDVNFYSLEYTYRLGNHQKQSNFNPDFFIKVKRSNMIYILVVEIKSDRDDSIENKAKYKYGINHFLELNNQLEMMGVNEKYIFHFLSPVDYHVFFDYIKNERIFDSTVVFKSQLERLLED